MLDQIYGMETPVAAIRERHRAGGRKHALRIRRRARLITRYRD